MDNSSNPITPILSRRKPKLKVGFGRRKVLKLPRVKTTLTALMIQLCTWVIKTPTTLTALQTLKVKTKATVWMWSQLGGMYAEKSI